MVHLFLNKTVEDMIENLYKLQLLTLKTGIAIVENQNVSFIQTSLKVNENRHYFILIV